MKSFVAQKIRMSRMVTENGKWYGVTLLHVPTLTIVAIKKYENHTSVQVAWTECKKEKLSKPQSSELDKLQLPFFQNRCEVQWFKEELPNVGDKISFDQVFEIGDRVSISGKTIGHGFSGVMQRWNFAGQSASHGTSLKHRAAGSTGARNRNSTWKGMKMAGHYGAEIMTIHGMKIMDFDQEHSILAIAGGVVGKNGWVTLSHRTGVTS